MHNPFDLLLLFQDRKFRPYWFESGSPFFLIRMLKAREVTLSTLKDLAQQEVVAASLAAFDLDYISTAALMFDAGYLTLGGERRVAERLIYKLRFPNEDVWRSLENLMPCAKQMPVAQ